MGSQASPPNPREAKWWQTEEDGRILCTLCPRDCRIGEGQSGFCFIRRHENGRLLNYGYGTSTGFAVDPIEKKPLSHFHPGTSVLSFGTAGCNLGCKFCQNWHISKAHLDATASHQITPESVVALATKHRCPSIAFTYNDPTIIGEFVIDVSLEARAAGLYPVLVTAGYISPKARSEVYANIAAVNIDLKAFSEPFYRKLTLSDIKPVLDTIRWVANETDIWMELTTLLIPGHNDSSTEISSMCEWILEECGPHIPLHFTAFHPDFKMKHVPHTPQETLRRARSLAQKAGIAHVYIGNIHDPEGQTTSCQSCGSVLIQRDWHSILQYRLQGNRCPDCEEPLVGHFPPSTPSRTDSRPHRAH